ncbi:hypothetical protein B0H13DRAFT_1858904 [Mycena leptocephala]|nr:hypothetical protein B0H13DRAFT_1858904 [Mycena leptocephala]
MPLRPALEESDNSSPEVLHSQSFVLLQSMSRHDMKSLREHLGINDNKFVYSEFKTLNGKLRNPMVGADSSGVPWIWIAPRYGYLIGPIHRFPTSTVPLSGRHPCYGLRALHPLPTAHGPRDEPLECHAEYCPGQETAPVCTHIPASIFFLTFYVRQILAGLLSGVPHAGQRPTTPPQQPSLIRQRSRQSQGAQRSSRKTEAAECREQALFPHPHPLACKGG